jgi:Flp pilus assembly protein TadG
VVELVLLLPVLLVVLFAIIQFGTVLNDYLRVTGAAREAARTAATSTIGHTCSEVDALATASAHRASPELDWSRTGADVSVSRTCSGGAVPDGTDLTVTAAYPATIALLGHVMYSGSLSSSTTMRTQ